jgi:hypothetical protein
MLAMAALSTAAWSSPAHAQVASLGTPPPEAESSAAPDVELSEQDAMLAYAECMRDAGVEVTDPVFDAAGGLVDGLEFGTDAKGVDAKGEGFTEATAACEHFLVAFKAPADAELQAEQLERELAFAACMRDQGLDWPDPAADGSKFAGADIKLDKESPQFDTAFAACGEELALGQGGSGT